VFPHQFNFDQLFVPPLELGEGQCRNEFGSEILDGFYFPAPPVPPLCVPSSTPQTPFQNHLPPSFSSKRGEMSNSIQTDPFDAAFAAIDEERVTHAPLLVQTSFREACRYSSRFPRGHLLNPSFVHAYDLGDELGSGGYGFVMTAYNRVQDQEVAVKFIIKDKVSEHAWTEDDVFGRLPTEIILLGLIDHENIVKCLDLFEDELYFYLVRQMHSW
jgi:PAS domain-containing serine/threonine kinase